MKKDDPNELKYVGINACLALFDARPDAIHRAFFNEGTVKRFGPLMRSLAERKRPYRVVGDDELLKISGTRHHEGVCLVADEPPEPNYRDALDAVEGPARWVFLDGVDNPHNVGAVLRTAAHVGRSALAVHRKRVRSLSGVVARVAEGAVERVPLFYWDNPADALQRARRQGFVLAATVVQHGRSLFETELPEKCLFMIGAEATGLSESALEIADIGVTIPGTGAVDSLNVAAATAILLAEHARRFGV